MRFFKCLGIISMFVFFACNNSTDEYEAMNAILLQADTIYQHPDGEIFDTCYTDAYQLLPELINAARFFVARHDNEKAAQTFLFCGYAQKEANDKASAMKSFKDAELYGNLSGDSLTTARAQFNIAKFMMADFEYDEVFDIAAIAENNFQNHYDEQAFVQNLIASAYILQKNYEIAELHLKQGLAFAEKGHSSRAKHKILNNYSVFYREQGNYEQAIHCLKQNMEEAESNALAINYLNIGMIYIYSNQFDSAAFYTQKALDLSKLINIKPETEVSIYFSLYYIAKMQENYPLALSYHEIHEKLLYKIQTGIAKKTLYNIQQQYDYEALQNKMNKQIIQKQRIILVVSFLLLGASIIVIGLLLRQKKIIKDDERIRQELDKTKEELQNSIKPEVLEEELSRQLRLIIKANRIAKTADDFKKEWSTLVYKINNEKDSMFEAAVVAIERVYPEMYRTIKMKYKNLNETDSKVMLLSCSDLTNTEIGYILDLSVHSVNKSRSSINKKFSVPDGLESPTS